MTIKAMVLPALLMALGCSKPHGADLVGASDFRFSIEAYNWEIAGSEVTRIGPGAEVEHIAYRGVMEGGAYTPYWFRRTHVVSGAALEGLQRLLTQRDFLQLDASYVNKDSADGEMTTFTLTAAGATKEVYCSNLFPSSIRDIERYVREQIVGAIPKTVVARRLNRAEAVNAGAAR